MINTKSLFEDPEELNPFALPDYSTREEISHPNAFEEVKDKNILVFAGKYDSVSPIEEMILPLWNKLATHKTSAVQKLVEYPTEHGLIGRRISMIREIADFINRVIA